MSNLIDNLLLSETTTSNTTSAVDQVNKDKPSLFDSLLSNITSSEDGNIVDSTTTSITSEKKQMQDNNVKTTGVSETNILNSESLLDLENSENLDLENITSKNNEQKITTGSLLDKLVIEAKKSVALEQPTKNKPSLFDSLLSNITSSEDSNIVDSNATSISSSKIQIQDNNVKTIGILQTDTLNSDLAKNIQVTGNDEKVENIDSLLSESTNTNIPKVDSELIDPDYLKNSNQSDILTNIANEEIHVEFIEEDLKISNKDSSNTNIFDENNNLESLSNLNQEFSLEQLTVDNKPLVVDENIVTQQVAIPSISLVENLEIETKKDEKNIINNDLFSIEKSEEVISIDTNKKLVQSEYKSINDTSNLKLDNNDILLSITKENIENLVEDKNSLPLVLDKTNTRSLENNINILSNNKKDDSLAKTLDENLPTKIVTLTESNLEILKENTDSLVLENNTTSTILNENSETTVIKEVETNTEVIQVKKDEKLSLMDQLIQKNSEKLIVSDTIADSTIENPTKEIIKQDLISNIYLGSQKNQINNQNLFNKNEAVSILKEGNSVQAIKTSAEILDLGLEEISLNESIETDKLDLKQLDKKGILENLLLRKNIKSEEIKHLITTSIEASKALIEDSITIASDAIVNVNSPIAYNIQSRIIGAKQQMATMMSDISRQMYENYKPPVTAFKINLNPTELGSIAILMKSDKNSGLSITMNVSNSVTLDTLIENQNVLKNSLNKTFDENTKFNLDFGSSNQNSSNQSSDNQNNNRQFERQMDTQSILQLKEENKDIEEKVIDYM